MLALQRGVASVQARIGAVQDCRDIEFGKTDLETRFRWRRGKHAVDDTVRGVQRRSQFQPCPEAAVLTGEELVQRLRKFRLELHPDKTRLVEFGCYAAVNRQRRGQGKPETFAFLGFTHICGKTRSGRFTVLRQTIRQRLQAKLGEVQTELKRRMHEPIPELGKWLRAVVGGHMRYYGVPMNMPALFLFRSQVGWLWHRALSRRSQNVA